MRWTLDDIDWSAFDPAKVDPELLEIVKAASLVEANSPDYVTYLCSVFHDDPEFCEAAHQWGLEEAQHGKALAKWAQLADPEFDFEGALERFRRGYEQLPLDATESIRGSRAGELLARCIVESGTSSFYAAMKDYIDEPVLRQIAGRISADEVHHYKLFRVHLKKYEDRGAGIPLRERVRILLDRIDERDDDEFGYAYYSANIGDKANEPYDREKCALAYERVALGLYREPHLRQGARMMLKAIGFDTDSLLTRATMPVAWFLTQRRQRQLNRSAEEGATASPPIPQAA